MNLHASIALLFSCLISIDGLKILGVLPVPSKSHWLIGHEMIKSLVDAGHEATVVTTFPLKSPIKNYEEIDISDLVRKLEEGKLHFMIETQFLISFVQQIWILLP